MKTTLRVSDIQNLLGKASRGKVQYLVEHGFLTPEKDSEGVGDWRAYSPTNAVAFVVAGELIKSGVPRRKLKALFEKTLERKNYEFWFDPTREAGPNERQELIVEGNGDNWVLNQYPSDHVEIGKPDTFGKVRQPLFRKFNEHERRRVIVIDLIAIKREVRAYIAT
jgi:hypothetical protein